VIRTKLTGEWVVTLASPVKDQTGRLRAVIAIGTKLDRACWGWWLPPYFPSLPSSALACGANCAIGLCVTASGSPSAPVALFALAWACLSSDWFSAGFTPNVAR